MVVIIIMAVCTKPRHTNNSLFLEMIQSRNVIWELMEWSARVPAY